MAETETQEQVTPEVLRELLDYDPETGLLTWKERDVKWFKDGVRHRAQDIADRWNARWAGQPALATLTNKGGHLGGAIFGRKFYSHRVAFAIMTGRWPKNTIDHADGNPRNNRWSNLREATDAENLRNRKAYGSSGYKGVYASSNRPGHFQCMIQVHGKLQHLGYGKDPEALARLWDKHAKELHGEFAYLNFPDE